MSERTKTADDLFLDAAADALAGTEPTEREATESAAAYAASLQRIEGELGAIGIQIATLLGNRLA